MVARALSRDNPVSDKIDDDHINRAGNPGDHMDSLILKKLHGFHPHPPCKDMGDPAGGKETGKFPGFMTWIQDNLLVENFFVPDMIYGILFTMAEV